MELFGHQTTLFARLLKEGLSKEEALEFIKEHGVKMMLVDNLRPAVIGDDVAPKGRGYSHFTDGCGMVLPFGEALKGYTNIHQTTFEHGEGYRNKFADKPTDFAKFIRMNPEMFTPENQEWGIFTLAHLEQDVNSDDVWQRLVCACDTENDRVDYILTGKVVDGATFRKDMFRANIYMHTMFVGYIRNVLECDIQEQEFLEAVFASIDEWYNPVMAEPTKGYLKMDPRVFGAEHEDLGDLAKEIIASGMFRTRKQLDVITIELFENAMVSLNAVMNLMVHSRK